MKSGTFKLVLVLLVCTKFSFAQTTEIDQLRNKKVLRDSTIYSNFKNRMYKHKVTREIYKALFRDVYNSNSKGEVSILVKNPFTDFENKIIADISIKVLNVNGFSVFDTTRTPRNWSEKMANSLHKTTKENVILRQFLLFKVGDKLNALKLADNERLLRSNKIFHDARILVSPSEKGENYVDILVVVQDVWSLNPYINYSSTKKYILGLDQINFQGKGHTLSTYLGYQTVLPNLQKIGFWGKYYVPSLIPRTYLSGQARVESNYQNQLLSFNVSRPFLRPETKWAGSGDLSASKTLYELFDDSDTLRRFYISSLKSDFWLGRSFRISKLASKRGDRLNVAFRKININYFNQKVNSALFQDINQSLISVGYSSRKYQRDVLVYGFGRTEDVPIGRLASIVWGFDKAEFGQRIYSALNYSAGHYFNRKGYVNATFNMGGYFRKDGTQDAKIIEGQLNYFSPLMKMLQRKDWYWRQFINIYYTKGINRYNLEYIYLNDNEKGFKGVNNMFLRGTERFVVSLESVFFSPINILGFRLANFCYVDLGKINSSKVSFLKSPLYYGVGIGSRLRNENLTFGDIQIKLGYYPTIPGQAKSLIFDIGTIIPLRFRDFNIQAPSSLVFK